MTVRRGNSTGWVVDSTRDDLEVAGPLDFVTAVKLSAQLNEQALELERAIAEHHQPQQARPTS